MHRENQPKKVNGTYPYLTELDLTVPSLLHLWISFSNLVEQLNEKLILGVQSLWSPSIRKYWWTWHLQKTIQMKVVWITKWFGCLSSIWINPGIQYESINSVLRLICCWIYSNISVKVNMLDWQCNCYFFIIIWIWSLV